MEKLNLMLTLAGTAVSVREAIDKAEAKSRKGKEVGQAKINQEIQIVGISWEEWYRRSEAAIAILKGGKIGKADKRLSDAEDQITDLTEKLQQATADMEQATAALEEAAASLTGGAAALAQAETLLAQKDEENEQHLAYIKELEGRQPAQDSAPGEEAKESPTTEVE